MSWTFSSATAKSCARLKRSEGCFASAFRTIESTSFGSDGRRWLGGTGWRTTWSRSSTAAFVLENGGLPTSISYRTRPRPYTSLPTVARLPSTRSGDDVERRREQLRRVGVLLRRACDAEVADLRLVLEIEEDVRRLQVGVDDAFRVRELEALRDVRPDPHRVGKQERTGALDALLQGDAFDELHDDEGAAVDLADVVHGHHVRVLELRERLAFLHEQAAQVLLLGRAVVEDLDRDLTR